MTRFQSQTTPSLPTSLQRDVVFDASFLDFLIDFRLKSEPQSELYNFHARFYDPELGRFISHDAAPPILEEPLTLNTYQYSQNNPTNRVDPDGRRSYVINGINNSVFNQNSVLPQPPKSILDFSTAVNTNLGHMEVRTVPGIYSEGIVRDLLSVGAEMINMGQYSASIANYIKQDIKSDLLRAGERLNLIGYSGGGQIAFNVADHLSGFMEVDNLITLGSPFSEWTRGNINSVTHFSSWKDGISWPSIADFRSRHMFYDRVEHSGSNSWLNNNQVVDDVSTILRQ
jgi:RHS repeat-associated protein